METTPKTRRASRRRRRMVGLLVGVLAAASMTTAALSLAMFTSSATAAAGFGAGTVRIYANSENNEVTPAMPPASITFTGASNMKPGDSTTGRVLVENKGTLGLEYQVTLATAASVAGKSDLAGALNVTITEYSGDQNCATPGPGTLQGVVYTGALTTGLLVDFGTANHRSLVAATGQATLCMAVTLRSDADNTYQGAGTSATFQFLAEQL